MREKKAARVAEERKNFYKHELITSKSKAEFLKEYKKYDESSARKFYLEVLSELENSVEKGCISNLKYLSNAIDNVSIVENQMTLKLHHDDASNNLKNTNLVILACKHNQVEILKYIFSNDRILKNLSIHNERNILPSDEDKTCHNAFYYAIRSNNVELLEILVDWSEKFYDTYFDELDEILSSAFEELKLKNVLLTDEMEISIANKLVNLRFFSDNYRQNQITVSDINKIEKRIELILENINLLAAEYSNAEVDEIFLYVIKFIAQNINILKQQLKSTYDRLPWEEIEFCLICFVSLLTKQQEINLCYHAVLDKTKILRYLKNFAAKLEEVKRSLKGVSISELAKIPNLNREIVVKKIIQSYPEFEELYENYHQIRDIYSLEKIGDYINLALSVDSIEREGQLIIMRVLQIMGEYIKNTLESPNLSNFTSELFLLSLSKNTRNIITDLRNSLSHASSLIQRTKIEENSEISFFIGVQRDFKKIGDSIVDILYNNKIKNFKMFLKQIVEIENFNEIREIVKALENVEISKMVSVNFRLLQHEKLKDLLKELDNNITDKTDLEVKLFAKIAERMNFVKNELKFFNNDYFMGFTLLKSLKQFLNENRFDHKILIAIKYQAKEYLKKISSQIESDSQKEIVKLCKKIFLNVKLRKCNDNIDKINRLFYEIFYISEFQTGDIKWIAEFRGKLKEESTPTCRQKQSNTCNAGEKNKIHLELKLSELKNVLGNKFLNDEKIKSIQSCKNDKKLQAVVEMLLLDIMSFLCISNHYLGNNLFFLDDNSPLPSGKCLRNHLAHDNTLFDILLSSPLTAVILNAKRITEEDIITSKKKIGKMITDDPVKLREKHNQTLKAITYQKRMFTALEEENLEILKECLKKGADIHARSMNSWTALHYAAKASNLEMTKFILEQNVQVNVKDQNGQNVLHIASAYGNTNMIEYCIKEVGFSVNIVDGNGRTPLHIAAQKGQNDTLEILLKYNADRTLKDASSFLPLHYAIENNHLQITKILLEKDGKSDIYETLGGITPLHVAAECGHLEIVIFLLQNHANVDAKNDMNWTPLHVAAFNGYVDVVYALILEGADVNAKITGTGRTPLHVALEKRHEEVANILVSHGAEMNISETTLNCMPLHYAAKYGYESLVQSLLKCGADATTATIEGITPLHFAAQSGHLEIATILLQHDVEIHAKDLHNFTPLHYAAENGKKDIATLLIKSKAAIDAKAANGYTPLYVAVQKGHEDIVDLLIKHKANINAMDIEENTILHAAVINGSKDILDILMKHKAKVNARDSDGITPLHLAALKGTEDTVVFLIENGAEVNLRDCTGFTPLHFAIIGGHKNIALILMKNKANINTRTFEGHTSLHLAVEAGQREITELLIQKGADVNVNRNTELTILLISAIKCNHREIVDILISNGADVNAENGEPLLAAVLAGYRNIVEILIKNKAQLDIVDSENTTLLHFAAHRGHREIVKILIKKGFDVNAKTINNITPVYFAAQDGNEDVVEFLIANGANLHVASDEGLTPLHAAAAEGHSCIIRVLIDNGANINVKDHKSRSPLELAVVNSHLQVVKILLQYKKIELNAKCNDDTTILHIAAQKSNLEIIQHLVKEGADMNSKNSSGAKPIHIACRESFKDAIEYFLDKGCDVNDLGASNQTLLHYAVKKGNQEIVKFLLDHGANVNATDANNTSPIHIAAKLGYIDIIAILLKNGAAYSAADSLGRKPLDMATKKDVCKYLIRTETFFEAAKGNNIPVLKSYIKVGVVVDVRNIDGVTPLHFAAWKGYEEVLNILLQNDANPNIISNKGITPLHYAAKFSHLKLVKILLSHGAIFNAVSDSGKTPFDLSTEKNIISLFKLISDSFKKIKDGNSKVINDLNKIKDISTIIAIMKACNKEKETIIVTAIQCNFPKIQQLKDILQEDTSDSVNVALMLAEHEDFQNALCIFNNLYEKRKYIFGPNNPSTLEIKRHIATILYKQGNYTEALHMHEEIYEKQKEILGLNNKDTLKTRSGLALVLYRQGRNQEAYEIFKEVHPKQKEVLGPNHEDIVMTEAHMSAVLMVLGKNEEALDINKRHYEERKRKFGANDPTVLRMQNNIALVLANLGDYEQSLEMYRDVLQKKKQVMGLYHTDTLRTLQTIASILVQQKKYREALQAYQELLGMQNKSLGPEHPETLKTQHALASLLLQQGKHANALKIFTECFEKMKAACGPTSAIVLDISAKIEMIKFRFKLQGEEASKILQHMQDDIRKAIENGDASTILRLLKEGTNINEKDSDGRALLHYAVSYEQINIVNILIENGAGVFQVTNSGNTPLHIAVLKNNSEIVNILLQHVHHDELNNFVNAKTTSGNSTALHVAAKNGAISIVETLLRHGAIYDVRNKEGKKPLQLSTDQNVTNTLKLVEEMFNDAENGNEKILQKLKSIQQDKFLAVSKARNGKKNTILQVAIAKKHKNIANVLLQMLKS